MPIPMLLHPIPVSIQVSMPANTFFDDDFRETVQQSARSATVIVNGQPKWGKDVSLDMQKGGAREDSIGYVLFRYVDLDAASVDLKRGDRFTKIGTRDVEVYITEMLPEAHWDDQGGPTTVKAFFTDRQPGNQNKGNL